MNALFDLQRIAVIVHGLVAADGLPAFLGQLETSNE